jgi:hypothetical protein
VPPLPPFPIPFSSIETLRLLLLFATVWDGPNDENPNPPTAVGAPAAVEAISGYRAVGPCVAVSTADGGKTELTLVPLALALALALLFEASVDAIICGDINGDGTGDGDGPREANIPAVAL